MSRTTLPYYADDISALARSLAQQLSALDGPPGHVQVLNALARATGFRNYQSYRAEHKRTVPTARPAPPCLPAPKDHAQLLRFFDDSGRLLRWPTKASHRLPCVLGVWAQMPARIAMSEREVNAWIISALAFEDHVLIRRELVNHGLLARTPDGRVYRRVELPVPEAHASLVSEVCRRARPSTS
ncbi:DUF2087 domain-containing protein [Niveibacterium umoris]|uniref:DUF2087 domain-containing protein n=1 Tax=Niveibacterium umoris TaxID=1193620 RepID=A0A840BJP5_9RHOO|nr:hypothetical protein [Niveibacterium umoris]